MSRFFTESQPAREKVQGHSQITNKLNSQFWQILHTNELMKNLLKAQSILDKDDKNIGDGDSAILTRPTVHSIAFVILASAMDKRERSTLIQNVFKEAKMGVTYSDQEYIQLVQELPWETIYNMQKSGSFNVNIVTGLKTKFIEALPTTIPSIKELATAITQDGDPSELIIITESKIKENWKNKMIKTTFQDAPSWKTPIKRFDSLNSSSYGISKEVLETLLKQQNSFALVNIKTPTDTDFRPLNEKDVAAFQENTVYMTSLHVPIPKASENSTQKTSKIDTSAIEKNEYLTTMPLTNVAPSIYKHFIGRRFKETANIDEVKVQLQAQAQMDEKGFSAESKQIVQLVYRSMNCDFKMTPITATPPTKIEIYYPHISILIPGEGSEYRFGRQPRLSPEASMGCFLECETPNSGVIIFPGHNHPKDVLDYTQRAYQDAAEHQKSQACKKTF
ncbi:MAG TPA: hypothetical protein QF353_05205 [Gammaproteobacteria bacterium]|nr:hypothetical protein [Gammaproteobacteria bacterium]